MNPADRTFLQHVSRLLSAGHLPSPRKAEIFRRIAHSRTRTYWVYWRRGQKPKRGWYVLSKRPKTRKGEWRLYRRFIAADPACVWMHAAKLLGFKTMEKEEEQCAD